MPLELSTAHAYGPWTDVKRTINSVTDSRWSTHVEACTGSHCISDSRDIGRAGNQGDGSGRSSLPNGVDALVVCSTTPVA